MDKITVKRIIALLDETEVNSEEDYVKLVHKIKDWNERTKAETKSTKTEKVEKKKVLHLTEDDINDVCDSAQEIVQDELDKINAELRDTPNPVNQFEFVNRKMNESRLLTGQIHGINMIRESLLHDYALKSK